MSVDLKAIRTKWLNQCGPCDYGMSEYGCTHPQEDYRPVIMSLVLEVERLTERNGRLELQQHSYLGALAERDKALAKLAGSELLHVCYGCQEVIAVADQIEVTMPDAIEYWHDKCRNGGTS